MLELRSCQPPSIPPAGPFSCGLHPWHLDAEFLERDLDALRAILADPRCLAVGECGLDRAVAISWELQEHAFAAQVALSEQVGKPLVVHCVRSVSDIVHWRRRSRARQPWIVHGFQGGLESARQALRAGLHLSFGRGILAGRDSLPGRRSGDATADRALAAAEEPASSSGAGHQRGQGEEIGNPVRRAIRLDPPPSPVEQVFAALPIEGIFLETDETPVPIAAVYARAAAVRAMAIEDLAAAVRLNFGRCFPAHGLRLGQENGVGRDGGKL